MEKLKPIQTTGKIDDHKRRTIRGITLSLLISLIVAWGVAIISYVNTTNYVLKHSDPSRLHDVPIGNNQLLICAIAFMVATLLSFAYLIYSCSTILDLTSKDSEKITNCQSISVNEQKEDKAENE